MKLNLWCSFHHADTALPICLQQTFIRVLICDKRIALFMRYCNEITAVQLTGITQDIDLLHNGEQCFQQTASVYRFPFSSIAFTLKKAFDS